MDYDGEKSYLDLPSKSNTIAVQPFDSTSDDAYQWTINDLSVLSQSDLKYPDYNIGIESLKYDGYGLILNYNNTDTQKNNKPMFRAYKDIKTKYKTEGYSALQLYKVTDVQISSENYFESLETKTSLKASGTIKQQDVTAIDFNTYDVSSGLTYGPEDIENKLKTIDDGWSVAGNGVEIEEHNGIKFAMQSQGYITFSNNNKKFSSVSVTLKYIDDLEVTTEENKTPIKPIKLKGDSYIFNFNEPTSSFTIKNIYDGYANLTDAIIINESPLAEMDNLSIRFGTNIPMDKFVKEASYGIIIADGTKIAEGADLNNLYNGSPTAEDYVTYLKQKSISAYQMAFASEEIAYVATPNSTVALDETDPNAKYAQFALVIDDLLEHMDQTFAAVCYMEYEGQLYLMKEARHSINSVVDAYLADEEIMGTLTDNSVAILNALNAM